MDYSFWPLSLQPSFVFLYLELSSSLTGLQESWRGEHPLKSSGGPDKGLDLILHLSNAQPPSHLIGVQTKREPQVWLFSCTWCLPISYFGGHLERMLSLGQSTVPQWAWLPEAKHLWKWITLSELSLHLPSWSFCSQPENQVKGNKSNLHNGCSHSPLFSDALEHLVYGFLRFWRIIASQSWNWSATGIQSYAMSVSHFCTEMVKQKKYV